MKNSLIVKESVETSTSDNIVNLKGYTLLMKGYRQFATLKNSSLKTYSKNAHLFVREEETKPLDVVDIRANIVSLRVKLDTAQYLIPQNTGLHNLVIKAVAGQKMTLKLNSINTIRDTVVVDLLNLPASLYYDRENSSIEGIPFVLGRHELTAVLYNKNIVKIYLEIVSSDLARGL
jgi:hypothetical protein